MDPIDAIILAIVVSVTGTLAITFGIGWFRAGRRVRALERQLSLSEPDAEVAHLESALVSLSEHVEQLASGQDFLSRLFTDRLQPPPAKPPVSEMVTPR
jgi:hypothetical protein